VWPKRNRQERSHTERDGCGSKAGERSVRVQSICHTFTVRRARYPDPK